MPNAGSCPYVLTYFYKIKAFTWAFLDASNNIQLCRKLINVIINNVFGLGFLCKKQSG